MRNLAQFGRRELVAHRRFVTGVTASAPAYKEVDPLGNKEWVVDVYIGPLEEVELNIVRDVPIAPYARQVVGDLRQPVLLERSKQGRYTLVGRAKTMPSGAQMPEGSILEPTYHRIEFNLAELRTTFVADLTYELEGWDEKIWDDGEPWQRITGTDAFGNLVVGPDVDPEDAIPLLEPAGFKQTLARHTVLSLRTWGNPLDECGFRWDVDPWNAACPKIVENIE
ncbi:MAG: hypothetical protein ACRD1X_14555 [Vicinamibacteria bacterium]